MGALYFSNKFQEEIPFDQLSKFGAFWYEYFLLVFGLGTEFYMFIPNKSGAFWYKLVFVYLYIRQIKWVVEI